MHQILQIYLLLLLVPYLPYIKVLLVRPANKFVKFDEDLI